MDVNSTFGAALISFSTVAATGPTCLTTETQVKEWDYSYAQVAPYEGPAELHDKYRFAGLLDSEREALERMLEIATDMLTGSEELPARYSRILDEEFFNLL